MRILPRITAGLLAIASVKAAAQTLDNSGRRTDKADAAAKNAPAIVPRSFQILRVVLPPDFASDSVITYEVKPATGVSVISTHRGTVASAAGDRYVLLTYGVPARAIAGALPVATVVFSATGGRAASVPVGVEVSTVRNVVVDLLQRARGTKPGGKVPLRFRVSNRGNAVDTVVVHYELPYDWRTMDRRDSAVVVLGAGETRVEETAVRVPNSSGGGSYSIGVRASSADSTQQGTDKMYVEVPTAHQTPSSRSVAVNTTFSRVSGAADGGAGLLSLAFSGQVYRDVNLTMDATSSPALSENGRYKLSSLGQFPQPPNFGLSTNSWRARVGGVGASFSDLTGQGAGGRGVSFSVDKPKFTVASVLAGDAVGFTNHIAGDTVAGPTVIGARFGAQVLGPNWLTGTVAHIDEGSAFGSRKLDVASVGTLYPNMFGGTLVGEVALRHYPSGNGLGLLSEYTRTKETDRMQLRALYAPGGTAAFAPANASFTGFFNRKMTESWLLGGSAWATSNSVAGGESARSAGMTLTPHYILSQSVSLGLDAGVNGQTLTAHAISFGNNESHLSTVANFAPFSRTNLSVVGTVAQVTRGVAADSTGTIHNLSSPRTALQGSFSQGTPWFGTLSLIAALSNDASNTVGLPRQGLLSLRLDRFPLYLPGGYSVYATGVAQRLDWFGDRPSVLTMRGDLVAELPFHLSVGFSVDRNPLVALPGQGPWTTAFHVGRTTYLGIPSALRYGSRKGMVFQDLNANGIRDPNETGLGGVIIRRGPDYVTTEEDGSFKFANGPDTRTQRLLLDPRSLPEGWMDRGAPTNEADAKKIKAIGIIPTSAVRMRLVVRREDAGTSGNLDLSAIVIRARDATGRVYVAQPDTVGIQSFSALPPGDYTVEVDPSAAGQLQVTDAPHGFRIGAERAGQEFSIELQTRSVRIKTFPSSGSSATPPAADATKVKPAAPAPAAAAPKPRRSTGAVADTVSVDEARKARPIPPRDSSAYERIFLFPR